MMKKVLMGSLIFCIVAVAALIGYSLYENRVFFDGDMVKNPDYYYLKFEIMTQEDWHDLVLSEGDTIDVDFDIDWGKVDLSIGIIGEEPIYRGNDIDVGRFELTVPKDGSYQIAVAAKHASGYIKITAQDLEK